jgi:peroxiredoxin 2/4
VRAVFAIDPKRKIRAILYYPMQLGRSVDELLRIFDGLQTADQGGVSIPCDWVPGQPVIVPAPGTLEGARKRAKAEEKDLNVATWYLSTRENPPVAK